MASTAQASGLTVQRLDALGDGNAILIELILPQEAVHERAPKLLLRARSALRAPPSWVKTHDLVELDHDGLLLVGSLR